MEKPKFKMTVDEILRFNDDCEEAASRCPQAKIFYFSDRQILKKEVSAKEVLKVWSKDGTLWDMGYDEGLSADAVYWFEQYKKYKILKKAWKIGKAIDLDW